jgi:hypothetical protein
MELELTDFQERIEALVLTTPARAKHSARSAIRHIRKAWLIRELDREMAVFHAITGEEEAATAIFYSLKRHHYPGADQLKPHDHVHKNAVYPFFNAVGFILNLLVEWGLKPQVVIDKKGDKPKAQVRITMLGGEQYVYPDPPLHYIIKRDGEVYNFSDEFKAIVDSSRIASIREFLRELANERNQLLYAAPGGLLTYTQPVDEILKEHQGRIFNMLAVYLLIDQYSQVQWFVQQCLNAFLEVLGRLPADFNFE